MTNDSMLAVVKLTSQRNVHWGQAPPESALSPLTSRAWLKCVRGNGILQPY